MAKKGRNRDTASKSAQAESTKDSKSSIIKGICGLAALVFSVLGVFMIQTYQDLEQESVLLGNAISAVDSSCKIGDDYSDIWAWERVNRLTDCQAEWHKSEFQKRKGLFRKLTILNFTPKWKGQTALVKGLEDDTHGNLFKEAYNVALATSKAIKNNIDVTAISGTYFATLMKSKGVTEVQPASAALSVRRVSSSGTELELPTTYLKSLRDANGFQLQEAVGQGYVPTLQLSESQIADIINNIKVQANHEKK